jgi:hypothetical protein
VTFSFGCCSFQPSMTFWTTPELSLAAANVIGPRPENDGLFDTPDELLSSEEPQAVRTSPAATSTAEH